MSIASKMGAALGLVLATGTFAAGVENPVDPVTGNALPLKPFERVHLTADGKCGIIAGIDENFDRAQFSWQGACRFGLAHGWGFTIGSNGNAVREHFTYGWRDLALTLPKGYAKTYRNNRNWGGDYILASFAGMDHFDPARYYDNMAGTLVEERTGDNYQSDFVGLRTFPCPYKAFPEAPGYQPTKQQISLAKKACSKKKYDGATAEFILLSRRTQIRDSAGTWTDTGPSVQEVRVCQTTAIKDVPSCSGEAALAAAPLMERIAATIAADKTAVSTRRQDLIARFAPLEMAFNEKARAFAAGRNSR